MMVSPPNSPRHSARKLTAQSTEGNEIPGASTEVDLLSNASPIVKSVRWDEWHTHRIDWVKGKSSWFVDGVHLLDTRYSVPTVPSYFVMVCPPNSPTPPIF